MNRTHWLLDETGTMTANGTYADYGTFQVLLHRLPYTMVLAPGNTKKKQKKQTHTAPSFASVPYVNFYSNFCYDREWFAPKDPVN